MIRRALLILLVSYCGAFARTIALTDLDADQMASLDANAPEFGWAGFEQSPTVFGTVYMGTSASRATLIRFPLDRVPKGQRIVNAELILPVRVTQPSMRLYTWRLTADWGAGVCHLFRQVRPQQIAWSVPGARGSGVDRAAEPSRISTLTGGYQEVVINVTEDVALWYTGAAKNYGWSLTNEDPDAYTQFDSAMTNGRGRWQLRITYEPQ